MPNPLITVEELAGALGGAGAPVLLDVRWQLGGPPGRQSYLDGHLPGAVFVDLDTELAAPPGARGRHPLPSAESFTTAMRRAGVTYARPVVVYDAAPGTAAARAWWLLRYHGHPDVRVLDGGLAAWTDAEGAVETGDVAPRDGDFTAVPGGMPVLDVDGAAQVAREGVLVDARSGPRYRGEDEPIDPVAGHIPGAVNLPTTETLTDDGRFLPADALRLRIAALGLDQAAGEGERLGAYCGSGVTAAHLVLALEVAGLRAALYPGSWSEWVRDPSRPVATGPTPG